MKIEQLPAKDLAPYANNAKIHGAEQVEAIARSISEFGFNSPILIDADGVVIAGHGRLKAAKKLKLDTVPCIRLGHLTEQQRKAYILADNRLAERGEWDTDLLRRELESIDFAEMDFSTDDLLWEQTAQELAAEIASEPEHADQSEQRKKEKTEKQRKQAAATAANNPEASGVLWSWSYGKTIVIHDDNLTDLLAEALRRAEAGETDPLTRMFAESARFDQ